MKGLAIFRAFRAKTHLARGKAIINWAWLVLATSATHAGASPAPIVTSGDRFICTPIAVWDGDGPVWCSEGPKLRLTGIAAREMDGSCRPGQPCPSSTALAARDALVRMFGGKRGQFANGHIAVRGPALRCQSEGQGKGDRTAAWCILPDGTDVSCRMVSTGTVLRWARYDPTDRCRRGLHRW